MSEISLKIRVFGDAALRKKSTEVKTVTARHREVLSLMARTMYQDGGIGLAAPQVGINENMIVVDIGSGLYKLINPRIIEKEGKQAIEEGCLSVPGVCIKVPRARKILVKALDENTKPLDIKAEDLLACVLQHEMDHLKGKLIIDYASLLDQVKMKKKLAQLKKRARHEELSESETKSCKLQL